MKSLYALLSHSKLLQIVAVLSLGVILFVAAVPRSAYADPPCGDGKQPAAGCKQSPNANGECSNNVTFFGLEPWYKFLPVAVDNSKNGTGRCEVSLADHPILGNKSFVLLIALAILDDLVRVAALVSLFYVIYGGIQYTTSQGSPDSTTKARQTILNALIGLTLALLAVSIVNFVGNHIGGN